MFYHERLFRTAYPQCVPVSVHVCIAHKEVLMRSALSTDPTVRAI